LKQCQGVVPTVIDEIKKIEYASSSKANLTVNLKFPKEATMLLDFKRDKDNNVIAEDGRVFKINSNLELFEDEE